MNGMLEYQTQGFNGYAVKYSPFFDSRIAVASSGMSFFNLRGIRVALIRTLTCSAGDYLTFAC